MAWDWSHSSEAYANAYANLIDQPEEWIIECLAEWLAITTDEDGHDYFSIKEFEREVKRLRREAKRLPGITEAWAYEIWTRAEELNLCTNGGHRLYMCPDGCHTVSCDREEEEED